MKKIVVSNLEKQEFELIITEAAKHYKSERAFYNGVIAQGTWDRLKVGESALGNVSLKSYRGMVSKLWNSYERMLLDEAKWQIQMNIAPSLAEAFYNLKLEHAKHFIEHGAIISVNSSNMVVTGDEKSPGTTLRIEGGVNSVVNFNISIPSHQVPSGKDNRKEWFQKEFHKVVLK